MKFFAVALSALALAACSYLDRGVDFATENGSKAVANAVEGQCRRSMAARQDAYAVYLSEQRKLGSGKLLPFDCDGDDRPDF